MPAKKTAPAPFNVTDSLIVAYATNDRINRYLIDNLDGGTCSKQEASEALVSSSEAVRDLLKASLAGEGRIKGFKPDVGSFLGYLLAHDAHHRGQITMLARQVGHPLSLSAMYGLWEWGTR